MKAITEFATLALSKGISAKTALAGEGKSPEEIQASLGETFKFEGDKLKHFVNAIEVATANSDKLKRVVVVSLTEGEAAPAKGTKVEEAYYIPEFFGTPAQPTKEAVKMGMNNKRKDGPKQKTSPWGLSPEEIEAKKNASKNAAAKAAAGK